MTVKKKKDEFKETLTKLIRLRHEVAILRKQSGVDDFKADFGIAIVNYYEMVPYSQWPSELRSIFAALPERVLGAGTAFHELLPRSYQEVAQAPQKAEYENPGELLEGDVPPVAEVAPPALPADDLTDPPI